MDNKFSRAFQIVIGHEGGLSLNPADRGNWDSGVIGKGTLKGTKYGVSGAAYPHLDIANLTLADAERIYRENYWDRIGADDLPPPLALVAFDTAINSGVGRAREFLSQTQDWQAFLDLRLRFLKGLSSWGTFGRGWQKRVDTLRAQAAGWDVPPDPQKGTMNLINEAAQAAIRREYTLPEEESWCLAAARIVIERAFGWTDKALYKNLVTEKVDANRTDQFWAKDAEKSVISRRLTVPTYQSPIPGDWLFNHSVSRGHTGIVVAHLGGLYVLENAEVARGIKLYGAINLCPLHLWGGITTIARLPDAEVPDKAAAPRRVLIDDGSGARPVGEKRESFPQVRGVTVDPTPDKVTLYLNLGKEPPALPQK